MMATAPALGIYEKALPTHTDWSARLQCVADAGYGFVETCVGGARIFGDLNNPQSDISRRLAAAEGKTSVLKPEAGTTPRVFYIGLEKQLDGRVDGDSTADMMWRPATQGA